MTTKLTESILSPQNLSTLLREWLLHLKHQEPPRLYFSDTTASTKKPPPPELLQLGNFLTHPSLNWHCNQKPLNLLLLALPWAQTPVFFGPLASADHKKICPIALSGLSQRNQTLFQRQSFEDLHQAAWVFIPPSGKDLVIEHNRFRGLPLGATPSLHTPEPPLFLFHILTDTAHLLRAATPHLPSASKHSDNLWQPETSLDIGEWKAFILLGIHNQQQSHRSRHDTGDNYTTYHVKLVYEHSRLGKLLPLEKSIELKEENIPSIRTQRFLPLLQTLQNQFQQLFTFCEQTYAALAQFHPETQATAHHYGVLFKSSSAYAKGEPLVISVSIRQATEKTLEERTLQLQLDIVCNDPGVPPEYKKAKHQLPLTQPHGSLLQIVNDVSESFQQAQLLRLSC